MGDPFMNGILMVYLNTKFMRSYIKGLCMLLSVKLASGNNNSNVAKFIANGFTGSLRGWWDNIVTTQQKLENFGAIKQVVNPNNSIVTQHEDDVYTLVQTIFMHFAGVFPQQSERNRELL